MTSAVISALLKKTFDRKYLLTVPLAPMPISTSGSNTILSWALTLYSKPSKTKHQCYKSSSD